jgi:hypothetical protein
MGHKIWFATHVSPFTKIKDLCTKTNASISRYFLRRMNPAQDLAMKYG